MARGSAALIARSFNVADLAQALYIALSKAKPARRKAARKPRRRKSAARKRTSEVSQ